MYYSLALCRSLWYAFHHLTCPETCEVCIYSHLISEATEIQRVYMIYLRHSAKSEVLKLRFKLLSIWRKSPYSAPLTPTVSCNSGRMLEITHGTLAHPGTVTGVRKFCATQWGGNGDNPHPQWGC